MATKIDEVFADFNLRMGKSPQSARALAEAMRKIQAQAGIAADAVDRMGRKARKGGEQARKGGEDAKRGAKGFLSLGSAAKRMIAGFIGFAVVTRVVRGAIGIFTEFRQEMNNVRAILDATDSDFERLNATAKQLGATTQFTARDAASALTFLARTGLTTNEALAVLPRTLDLAAASAIDLGTAADISTNILKGMALEVSDLDNLVDVLAKTTNSSNVNMIELGEAMKVVAPVAAAAGMSVEETAALIGVLGDSGIKASLAGTSLRRGIINLTTGVGAAGPAIERLGLQTLDATGEFVGLTDIFRQLEGRTVSARDLLDLFGARGVAAAQVLARKGSAGIAEFTEALENAGGTAERMRKQQLEGLPGATLRMKSAFEGLAISTVDILEPALVAIANVMTDFIVPGLIGARTGFILTGQAIIGMAKIVANVLVGTFDVAIIAIFAVVEAFGFLLKELGEVGEVLGLEMGERIANAGLRIQRFGQQVRLGATAELKDMAKVMGEDLVTTIEGMNRELNKAADEINGAGAAAGAAAEQVDDLNDSVSTLADSVARIAIDTLNLEPFREQLVTLQEQIRAALSLEGVGALTNEELLMFAQRRDLTAEQIDDVQTLIDAESDLRDVVEELVVAQAELAAAGEDLEQVAEIEDEIVDLVKDIVDATRAAEKAMQGFGKESGDAGSELADGITVALRGVNRIGDAFGFLGQDIRRAVDSALDLVGAIKAASSASAGLTLAGGIGIAGAAAGLLGGLFGGGGAAQEAAQRAQEENTDALRKLGRDLGALGEILFNITGTIIREAEQALDAIFDRGLEFIDTLTIGAIVSEEELNALQRFGESVGITVDAIGEADGGFKVLRADLEALKAAMDKIDLEALTSTFGGATSIAEQRRELQDADDDALRAAQEMLDIFLEFTDLPPGLDALLKSFDLSTPAGRAALNQFINQLFEGIVSGQLDPSILGDLTTAEFLAGLVDIEKILDDLEKDAEETAGGTSNFVRDSRITVAQGSVVIAILDSIRLLNRLQLDELQILTGSAGAGALVPPPAAAVSSTFQTGGLTAAGSGVQIDAVNITVPVQSAEGATRAAGRQFGISIAESFDSELKEIERRRQRGAGEQVTPIATT